MKYKAFISYSHAADGKIAPALQSALHAFAKPWYKLRAMRVFRDQTNLALNPQLWSSIERALNESEYFILLASPQAAQSKWVTQEITHWLTKHPLETVLIVLTEGEIKWDQTAGDFDWAKTTALPSTLSKVFTEEPLYLDFRSVRTQADLSLRNPEFLNKIARVAAPLHERSLDEMIGEDVEQHRRTQRWVRSAVIVLILLTVSAIAGGVIAWHQRNQAVSRELAAAAISQLNTDADLSVLLSVEAVSVARTQQAEAALRESLFKSRIREELREVARAAFTADPRLIARALDGKSVSPDGKWVATTTFGGFPNDTVEIANSSTGAKVARLVGDMSVSLLAWTPDADFVVAGTRVGRAHVWRTGEWTKASHMSLHHGPVDLLAFSPDGKSVATGSGEEHQGTPLDRSVWVWELKKGFPVAKLGGHKSKLAAIAFSWDGAFVITKDAHVTRVWRANTGELVAEWDSKRTTVWDLEHDAGAIEIMGGRLGERGESDVGIVDLAFSPEGSYLLTVARNGDRKLWSSSSAQELDGEDELVAKVFPTKTTTSPPRGHEHSPAFQVTSPDGRFAISGLHGGGAQLLERSSGAVITTLPDFSAPLTSVAFSPNGGLIALASYKQPEARVYRWETIAPFEELLRLVPLRVTRQLKPWEREYYLPKPIIDRVTDFLASMRRKAITLTAKENHQ